MLVQSNKVTEVCMSSEIELRKCNVRRISEVERHFRQVMTIRCSVRFRARARARVRVQAATIISTLTISQGDDFAKEASARAGYHERVCTHVRARSRDESSRVIS